MTAPTLRKPSRDQVLWVLSAVLLALTLKVNYQLWLAPSGGWAEVRELRYDVMLLRGQNDRLTLGNAGLRAEVDSLLNGLEAVEARARTGLGLIRRGETLFRPLPGATVEPAVAAPRR